jgi:hypothetical protein
MLYQVSVRFHAQLQWRIITLLMLLLLAITVTAGHIYHFYYFYIATIAKAVTVCASAATIVLECTADISIDSVLQ